MSISPLGWEQAAQSSQAQPSSGKCSTAAPDSHDSNAALAAPARASLQQTPARGFLNIVRHGAGPSAIYVVTYQQLNHLAASPKPVVAENARLLIDLLERLGVELDRSEVRGALEDILRLGSANIPDVWLAGEQLAEKGLISE